MSTNSRFKTPLQHKAHLATVDSPHLTRKSTLGAEFGFGDDSDRDSDIASDNDSDRASDSDVEEVDARAAPSAAAMPVDVVSRSDYEALEVQLRQEMATKDKALSTLAVVKDQAVKYKQRIDSLKDVSRTQRALLEKEYKALLQRKDTRIEDLELQVEELQETMARAPPASSEAASEELATAQAELRRLRNDYRRATSENDDLARQVDELRSSRTASAPGETGTSGGDSALRAELASVRKQLAERDEQIKSLEIENRKTREPDTPQPVAERRLLEDLRERVRSYEARVEQLTRDNERLATSAAAAAAAAAAASSGSSAADHDALASQLAALRVRHEASETELGRARDEAAALQARLAASEAAAERARDEAGAAAKSAHTAAESAQVRIAALERDLAEARSDVASARQAESAGNAGAASLRAELDELRARRSALEAELVSLKASATSSSAELEQQLADARARVAALDAANAASSQQLAAMQAAASAQSTELAGVKAAEASAAAEAAALKARVAELDAALDAGKSDEQARAAAHEQLAAELKEKSEKLSKVTGDAQQLAQVLQQQRKSVEELKTTNKQLAASNATMEAQLARLQSGSRALVSALAATRAQSSDLRKQHLLLKRDMLGQIGALQRDSLADLASVKSFGAALNREIKDLTARYRKEMSQRKKLHDRIIEMKGNIRVYCRVRPQTRKELNDNETSVVQYPEEGTIAVQDGEAGKKKVFEFDRIFDHSSTQENVFEDVEPLVTSVLDGYNVCIFAYGQTGSGKTYTMQGPAESPGVNTRAIDLLFRQMEERGSDYAYTVSVSVLEIYLDTIRDLLADQAVEERTPHDIKAGPNGMYVTNLTMATVVNMHDVQDLLERGARNRSVAETKMNADSSRSHLVLTVQVDGENLRSRQKSFAKLTMIDLAGSERLAKSGAVGQQRKEAVAINQSLSALGNTMNALLAKSQHIPYRDSKLTYLLQDSLGQQAKTLMFVQLSPARSNFGETLCSLQFAERVRKVELGVAKKAVDTPEVAAMRQELKELRARLKPSPPPPA